MFLAQIAMEVYEEQRELVRLAKECGVNDPQTMKRQLILMRSKNFRIRALDLLDKSPWSKIPGSDSVNFTRENRKETLKKLMKELR